MMIDPRYKNNPETQKEGKNGGRNMSELGPEGGSTINLFSFRYFYINNQKR